MRHIADARFAVAEPSFETLALEPSWQPDHLLVEDSQAGLRTHLAFEDYPYRRAREPASNRPFAFAQITHVDEQSETVSLAWQGDQNFGAPSPGTQYLLSPRFTDWTVDAAVDELAALDDDAQSPIVQVLSAPASLASETTITDPVAADARSLAASAGMTQSQLRAFDGILAGRLHLVWGPPGTGKTHFLALAALCLIEAHRRHDQAFRSLVTAFTHTAIDNVLVKAAQLQAEMGIVGDTAFAIAKAGAAPDAEWRRVNRCPLSLGLVTDARVGIVGSTAWGARRGYPAERAELVVIDEASQLKLPEAAVILRRLRRDGQLIVAGDDRQLPPIVLGAYPEPAPGEPPLHRSTLRGAPQPGHRRSLHLDPARELPKQPHHLPLPGQPALRPEYDSVDDAVGSLRIGLDCRRGNRSADSGDSRPGSSTCCRDHRRSSCRR